jgi:hypothetical protein
MTFRQRLLAVLNGDQPDVMPWFADLSYWYSAQQHRGLLPAEYEGPAGFVRLHRDYHVGYYLGYAAVYHTEFENVTVTQERAGLVTTTRWQTPVGEVWGQTQFSEETCAAAPVRWAVRTPEDLRVLRYLAEATRITPDDSDYAEQQRLAGDQGHPSVFPPRSPISQLLAEWTGVMNLTYLVADAPEAVQQTVTALENAADGAFAALVACDAPWVEFADNLSGEIIMPFFRRYQYDYYVRRLAQLHGAGKKVGVHLDGTLRGILPLLVEVGMDFIEAITPQPAGDVAVEDLRALAGPQVILWGGLPGAMFAPPFTAALMRRQVEKILEYHWPSANFILASADQVPPNGDMNLVRKVGEWVEELC